jgi:Protein of unknown function (DUF5818)
VRSTVLLIFVFLVSSICLQAQSTSPASDSAQTSGKASGLPTLTGCLREARGVYTLTEDDGTTHELSGGARNLRSHVGQEVEITGKPGTKTVDNTPPGGASSVVELAVFQVKSVKQVADQCK